MQKVDMCSGYPKSPIVNARAWHAATRAIMNSQLRRESRQSTRTVFEFLDFGNVDPRGIDPSSKRASFRGQSAGSPRSL